MNLIREGIDLFFSERYCSYRNIAAVFGVLWLSCLLLKVVKVIAGDFCASFLAPWGISRTNLKKYGFWAVVTGASEGIGRGYALETRTGFCDHESIRRKIAEREKYGREVRVIPVDFSKGMEIYPSLAEQLQDIDIGVLSKINSQHKYQNPQFCGVEVWSVYCDVLLVLVIHRLATVSMNPQTAWKISHQLQDYYSLLTTTNRE